MATRVALAACVCATEGQWTLTKGNEEGIRINGLGDGECVIVELETGESTDSLFFAKCGSFPVPFDFSRRYRVKKHGTGMPTTVEVLLNGNGTG